MANPDQSLASIPSDVDLARLRRAAGQFADEVSHEFRTPLTVIKEFVTILRDGLMGQVNAQQREFLDTIDDRTDDLAILVDNALDLGKLEAGLLRLWRRPCRIDEILDHVQPTLRRKAALKKVQFSTALDPDLPNVYGDPDRIIRVIVGLGASAIKSCGEASTVTLWAKRSSEADDVVVGFSTDAPEAADQEPEPSPEASESLDSESSDSLTTRPGKNLRLGMIVAQRLAELHLGRLDAASPSGHGESVSLALPVWDPVGLLRRHLHHLGQDAAQSGRLFFLEVSARRPMKPAAAGVVDEFLQHMLGACDLVLQVGPQRWLGAMTCWDEEARAIVTRLRDGWARLTEDRPGGLLPRIEFTLGGHGDPDTDPREIIERLDAQSPAIPSPARPTIMVAEDDGQMLRGLEIQLSAAGFTILTAADGRAAIKLARAHRPDAILMDHFMPVMDGLAALAHLQADDEMRDIPVIVLSAGLGDQQKALDLGARFFLQKPCDVQTIVAALGQVLEPADVSVTGR